MENSWTRISESKIGKDWFVYCRCRCGVEKHVLRRNLNSNKSTKCWRCSRNALGIKDMIGNKFGKYLVLSVNNDKSFSKDLSYMCQCDCGNKKIVRGISLRNGSSSQCKDCHSSYLIKHGLAHIPEYRVWKGMKARCFNKNNKNYHHYGGRGIVVCDKWLNFQFFIEDMGLRPEKKLQIDRINNNGNYEPGNCRWTTSSINMRNRRNSKRVLNGRTTNS